jgi:hypothetical protein
VSDEVDLLAIYRVTFSGGELTDAAKAAVTAAGAWWEGTASGPDELDRHRVLVEVAGEQQAIASVRAVLAPHGSFGQYAASPVRDSRGEVWRGPFYRKWQEIDWQAVPERAALIDIERAVLGALADAGEATWLVAKALDMAADRASVEAVLESLQDQNLVYSVLEEGGEPGKESEPDRWWAITDEGWDLLGFVKSPTYR